MRITITARHTDIPDELRARARELVQKVAKVATRPHHAQVTFSEAHNAAAVEVLLHTARGHMYVGIAEDGDHRSALDSAIGKIRHQLDKDKQKKPPVRRRGRRVEPGSQ
jgi:ribosomal subunit interface protein